MVRDRKAAPGAVHVNGGGGHELASCPTCPHPTSAPPAPSRTAGILLPSASAEATPSPAAMAAGEAAVCRPQCSPPWLRRTKCRRWSGSSKRQRWSNCRCSRGRLTRRHRVRGERSPPLQPRGRTLRRRLALRSGWTGPLGLRVHPGQPRARALDRGTKALCLRRSRGTGPSLPRRWRERARQRALRCSTPRA